MKYKVIAEILDGTVCANKSHIVCFVSNSLQNEDGDRIDPQMGEILSKHTTDNAEHYWSYSRKQWEKMNVEFEKLKKM